MLQNVEGREDYKLTVILLLLSVNLPSNDVMDITYDGIDPYYTFKLSDDGKIVELD